MLTTAVANSSATSTPTARNSLTADDFLALLVTELRMQDPLNPLDTAGMIQQLSQMEMVTETRLTREGQEFGQAISLLGKTVRWQDSATGAYYQGDVTGVVRDGSTSLLVVGDTLLKLSELVAIF